MTERDRVASSAFINEVRARVWRWDPVGLAHDGVPEDEYDCLIGPVTGGLRERLSASELAARLDSFVLHEFATKPARTDDFVADLLNWYEGWPVGS